MNEKIRLETLELTRQAVRERSLSGKTENAYLNHIRRFLEFGEGVGASEVERIRAFFAHLETHERLAVSTRNQALCALSFLYRDVFGREFSPQSFVRNERRASLPTRASCPPFFTSDEARAVLSQMRGAPLLAAALMYGAGLRLIEALNLRVGDIDFERGEIKVRDAATGARTRATMLPKSMIKPLEKHFVQIKFTHEDDSLRGYGAVRLPPAILKKQPDAARDWRWQYVFPACRLTAANGEFYRRHLAETTVQKAIGEAVERARIAKKVCCQTLRYSFAARLLERNTDVRTIQTLLGHKNLKTTRSYAGFLRSDSARIAPPQSPLDY